jgi:NAD(P)-dependent dehydrogenase (short-subunit alcohol dehydrogenase family)
MERALQEMRALVTGATSPVGRAVALALASAGATVAIGGRSEVRGWGLVDEIEAAGGDAVFVPADLDGSRAAAEGLADDATHLLGERIDILVNGADSPVVLRRRLGEREFDRIHAANVRAPYFLTARVAPEMLARGHGVIVNVPAIVDGRTAWLAPFYAASNGALGALGALWAEDFGRGGVRVKVIAIDAAPDSAARDVTAFAATRPPARGRGRMAVA